MARQDCCADRQTNCRALLWLQDRALAQEWAAEINAVIRQSPRRPRTLLVLLNPFGGCARRVVCGGTLRCLSLSWQVGLIGTWCPQTWLLSPLGSLPGWHSLSQVLGLRRGLAGAVCCVDLCNAASQVLASSLSVCVAHVPHKGQAHAGVNDAYMTACAPPSNLSPVNPAPVHLQACRQAPAQ